MAGKGAFDGDGVAAFVDKGVVVAEFFTSGDGPQGMNPDATVFMLDGFAIGFARVIDEACFVAIDCAVDQATVIEREKVGEVQRITIVATAIAFFQTDALAGVFDDRGPGFDGAQRKNTPPVDGRCLDEVDGQLRFRT